MNGGGVYARDEASEGGLEAVHEPADDGVARAVLVKDVADDDALLGHTAGDFHGASVGWKMASWLAPQRKRR